MSRTKVNIKRRSKKKEIASDYMNQVHLIGRLGGKAQERLLPSGDKVVEFRLIIGRDKGRNQTKQSVDTIDIAVWGAIGRKAALKFDENSWISVDGAIRRRFWQSPTGLASRWQVEASQISTI